jgi:hypothetical protein
MSKKKWAAGAAILCAAVMLASAGFLSTTRAETAPVESAGDDAALARLQEYNAGTKALSRKVMRGLVRVKLDQSPEALLSKELKVAWEDILRNPRIMNRGGGPGRFEITGPNRPGGAGGNPGWGGGGRGGPGGNQPQGRDQGGRERGRDDERRPAATAPAPAPLPKFTPQSVQLLEEFLRSRTTDQDPAKAADAQITLTKLRALRGTFNGDMYANIYSDTGHAFLMAGVVLAPDRTTPLHAYLPDGTEVGAKLCGSNFIRGYSVLKIVDKTGGNLKSTFNACAPEKSESGELVMTLSPNSGAINFGAMPMTGFGKKVETRFPFGGSGLLFTSRGEFSGFVAEGVATPVSALSEELKVLEEGRTIHPRTLGIRYDPLSADSQDRAKNKLLGTRPVVKVSAVTKESLADKAEIQKDDYIISIEGQPVTQLPRVLEEWQIRGTELKFEIVRGDEVLTKTIKSPK